MFQRYALHWFTLSAFLLCGCTASTTPTTDSLKEPAGTPASNTVTESPDVSFDSSNQASTAVTPSTSDLAASTDDAIEVTETTEGEAKELLTGQDYVAEIQKKLGGQTSNGPPSRESIDSAIALAEEGYAKLPEDKLMLNALVGLLYQTLPLEPEDVANKRRLRLGELARLIGEGTDPSDAQTAQVLLLEEAKAHVAGSDQTAAWDAVKDARELGFSQVEYLFYDPAFEQLVNDGAVSATIKEWMGEGIDAEFAANEEFPFDFTLQSFSGEEVSLASYAGKPVIVDLWGTWCPPCRKAIPHLVELQEERSDEIAVVGINFENQGGGIPFEDAKARLDQYLEVQPINYTCLHGQPETLQGVPGFEGFPTMLFLDRAGKVRLKLTGYIPKQKLEVIVDKLLAEQPQAGA